jgi:hypothetical protein
VQAKDERRQHRRLEIRLPLEFRAGSAGRVDIVRTITQNVSTGGLFVELDRADYAVGDLLDIELTLPAAEGVSAYTGRAKSRAEVIRIEHLPASGPHAIPRVGVAARFLDRLQLCY